MQAEDGSLRFSGCPECCAIGVKADIDILLADGGLGIRELEMEMRR